MTKPAVKFPNYLNRPLYQFTELIVFLLRDVNDTSDFQRDALMQPRPFSFLSVKA